MCTTCQANLRVYFGTQLLPLTRDITPTAREWPAVYNVLIL